MFHRARADTKETVQWLESIMPGWLFHLLGYLFCGCLAIILLYRVFQFFGWLFRGGKSRPTDEHASPTTTPSRSSRSEPGQKTYLGQAIAGLAGVLMMIFLVMRGLGLSGNGTEQPKKPVFVHLPTAPNARDAEELYLLYQLRYAYQFTIVDVRDGAGVAADWGRQRWEANRRLLEIRVKRLDPSLSTLYTGLIAAIDEVTAIWVSAGLLQQGAVTQAEAAYASGNSPIGAGKGVFNRNIGRDATGRDVPQNVIDATERTLSGYWERAQATADEMARRHGWSAALTGMATLKEDYATCKGAKAAQDLAGLAAWARRARSERPRDPGAVLIHCLVASAAPGVSTQQRAAFAEQCHAAATLVPPGREYDADRGEIMLGAASMLTSVARDEAEGGRSGGGSWIEPMRSFPQPQQHAQTAVQWFEAAEKLVNWPFSDTDGEFRLARVFALAMAGRPADALQQARTIHAICKDNPMYSYAMTALLAKTGLHEESVQWLTYLLAICTPDLVAALRSDPALGPLRQAKPGACEDLFRVKYEWQVKWGLVKDDILLTNKSAFGLTNVVFNPTITSGGKVWAPKLKAEQIGPGQTCTWRNAVSVPGSRLDSSSSTLICDQTEK